MRFSLIAFLSLLTVGCNKDDDSNGAADGELAAKVDGDEFKASTHVGATFYNGFFRITAMNDSTGETIIISVSNASEGTFDLGPDPYLYNDAEYTTPGGPNYSSGYEGGNGKINITSLNVENETASGTFSFTAVAGSESVEVTKGEFNNLVLLTEVPLSADVDGEAFNPIIVTSSLSQSKIFIIALNGNGERLSMEFPSDITIGNYEFGTSSNYKGLYYPNMGGSSGYLSESGTLAITSVDMNAGIVEGTFSFSAKRRGSNDPDVTYEITAGSFSAEIQ